MPCSNSSCNVQTWSGTNCGGSSVIIRPNSCRNVLYGSVSVNCLSATSRSVL